MGKPSLTGTLNLSKGSKILLQNQQINEEKGHLPAWQIHHMY